jgi:hypothetical protein
MYAAIIPAFSVLSATSAMDTMMAIGNTTTTFPHY